MAGWISLALLLASIALIGWLFVTVMGQFLLPLFLAVLLTILARPLHEWFVRNCRGRVRLAAAADDALHHADRAVAVGMGAGASGGPGRGASSDPSIRKNCGRPSSAAADRFWRPPASGPRNSISKSRRPRAGAASHRAIQLVDRARRLGDDAFVGGALLSMAILILAVYFFLADGPDFVDGILRLVPIARRNQLQILAEFGRVSRAVVMATLLSSLAQGVVAGIGYWLVGLTPIVLLSVMTMLLSLVPFVRRGGRVGQRRAVAVPGGRPHRRRHRAGRVGRGHRGDDRQRH